MPTLPLVGDEFAGYRLRAVIGRGGMSVVFQAENPRLGNIVALKVLAPELATDDVFRTRFLHESRTAASLSHPNVIPIFDVGPCQDLLYIAMRYVSGTDLRALLKKERQIAPARALVITGQVARALDAAHRRGLVHRDVKPGNILIGGETDDDGVHVYLADFGITKHTTSRSGLTSTGEFLGTIDYVAPEQIQGTPVDGRADQYSLGCVLYECLTGHVPFEKELDAAVIWAHVEELPPMPSTLVPELPSQVDDVFAKVLAKKATDRYPSCREFVEDARRVLAGYTDARKTVTSHRQPPAAASVGTLPPARLDRPGGADKRGGPSEPSSGGSGPAGPPGRWRGWRLPAALGALALIAAAGVGAWLATHSGSPGASATGGHSSSPAMKGPKSPILALLAAANTATENPTNLVTKATYPGGALPPSKCHALSMTKVTCSNPYLDVTRVKFQTFPSRQALYNAYETTVRSLNSGHFTANKGHCSARLSQGESSWNHQEQHPLIYTVPQVESGTLNKDSQAAGRLFCNFPNVLNIVWTQNDALLLGWLTATDHRVGFNWWADIHHNIPSASGSSMHM